MFEKFGEFDSAEEINKVAADQLEKGKIEEIIALAEENGIDREDAMDYIDGCVDVLATPIMAAMGKLEIEARELKLKGIVEDWKDNILEICMEEEEVCRAVRKKSKSMACCMALLLRFAFNNKVLISNRIVDITKVTHNGKEEPMRKPLYLGVPNRRDTKRIIREYYLG